MKFDELDINKWEDSESKSIDLTPFDKFSWKKIWVNSFDENYKDFPCKCGSKNCCGYIVREGSRWRIKKKKRNLINNFLKI